MSKSNNLYEFYPNGIEAENYQKLTLDFKNRETRLSNLKKVCDKNGEKKSSKILRSYYIDNVIMHISYMDDLSSYNQFYPNEPMILSIGFKDGSENYYLCDNFSHMVDIYKSLSPHHKRKAEEIIRFIFDEYGIKKQINYVDGSLNPGIYLSRNHKQIHQFKKEDGKVKEVFPDLPEKDKLLKSMTFLKELDQKIDWPNDKFGALLKLIMLLPYSFVLKQKNKWIKGIILSGTQNSQEELISNLIFYMSGADKFGLTKDECILSKDNFKNSISSLKDMLHYHSYPTVIQKADSILRKGAPLTYIRSSVQFQSLYSNRSGEKIYYARGAPILFVNKVKDKILKGNIFRRFFIFDCLEYKNNDSELYKIFEERKIDFKNLCLISDFVFRSFFDNPEYFKGQHQDIINSVLKDMEKYIDCDLRWLINADFEKYESIETYLD